MCPIKDSLRIHDEKISSYEKLREKKEIILVSVVMHVGQYIKIVMHRHDNKGNAEAPTKR